MDPGTMGQLTYTVSDPLFAVEQQANNRTARIIVNA